MHKTSTIFIVGKTVSGHKNRMNNRTAIDHLWEHYLAMGQFPFICFAYFVFITAEFHFAHIHNVVLATNEQVYLYTFFFIIASQSPSRLGGTDARNTNRGLSTPAVPVIFLSNCSCDIRLFNDSNDERCWSYVSISLIRRSEGQVWDWRDSHWFFFEEIKDLSTWSPMRRCS